MIQDLCARVAEVESSERQVFAGKPFANRQKPDRHFRLGASSIKNRFVEGLAEPMGGFEPSTY
jgi:hypothetical protein